MAPTQHFAVSPNSHTSELPSHRRWPALLLVLVVLVGSLTYLYRYAMIDEFQDTSLGQWELIRRLTAGWSEGDGRTVFLVGDAADPIGQAEDLVDHHHHRQAPGLMIKKKTIS